jgi:O-antigen ligase
MRSVLPYFFSKISKSRREPKPIDIILVLLFFCVITLPLSVRLNSIVLIITLVYRLMTYNWKQFGSELLRRKELLLPSLLVLAYSIGIIYSAHPQEGFFQLEKKFSLLAIPVIFLLLPELNKEDRISLLKSFVFSILIVSLICYAQAFYNIFTHLSLKVEGRERDYYYFSYIFLTDPVSIDPIYLSMYTIFCILIVLHLYTQERSTQIILLIYFIVFNLLIASRIGVLAMVFLLITHFAFTHSNKRKSALIMTLIIVLTVGALFFVQPLKERFIVDLHYSYSNDYSGSWNSVTMRLAIWNCALETLSNNWIFGYGTGDGLYALFDTYHAHNFIRGYEDEYNAHNEFLYMTLDLGVIGLLSLMIVFVRSFILGIYEKRTFFLEFILLIAIFCLVEVILNRQKGVVFFSFFYGLFMSDILNSRSEQKNG